MEFIEVSAKTVDDAITKACIELQAASDKLEIQVISCLLYTSPSPRDTR